LLEQRPIIPPRSALEQGGLIRRDPHHCPELFQKIEILRVTDDSAAGHDNRRPLRRQFAEHVCFCDAESLFTMLFKNLRDRNAELGRYHFVCVQASQPRPLLQTTADGRFPGSHHSDKDNRFGRVHVTICRLSDELKSSCDEPMADQTPVCRSRNLWSPS
jgi:hypothetical protein